MRNLHCVLILAFAILLKIIYSDSVNPLPNSPPLNYCPVKQAPPPQVKYYILVLQWPPGVCTGDSGVKCQIKTVPTEFTIHGLWPQPNGVESTDLLDPNQFTPLLSDLNKYWPDLKSAQQRETAHIDFWKHEWKDHGRYSGLGMPGYYEKSLELFKVDGQGLRAKLAAEKIIPTIYKTYKLVDIKAALNKINGGFSVTIICVQRLGSSNKQQIKEIQFRYTDTFQKENKSIHSNCGPDILFPAAA